MASNTIKNVNRRIANIKKHGLIPITLKSPADLIENFIHPKGTGIEGEFKSRKQYMFEHGYISKEEYENTIMGFINEYEEQLNTRGALRYQAERVLSSLENAGMYDDRLDNMTPAQIIKMIQVVGEATNDKKRAGYDSSSFYYLLTAYLDDFFEETE